ncbi:MAG: endonuclease VIII [Deltaproteobacteria bacterium]
MLELPEAYVIAGQIRDVLIGKSIKTVLAAMTPHKLAWYQGDPQTYPDLLTGEVITGAQSYGGWVQIEASKATMLFGDGVNLRFHQADEKLPVKHQLLLEFNDGSALSAAVQMYGGLLCFKGNELDNQYYRAAKDKPSPITAQFDRSYFDKMIEGPSVQKLSAKAFLATEQRIPGLGNGVLQDILYNAHIHPKKKIKELSPAEHGDMFHSVQGTLHMMKAEGGRDTERDLFGCPGGYKTLLSKNTVGKNCPRCQGVIRKENYLGGSIYYCDGCQVL